MVPGALQERQDCVHHLLEHEFWRSSHRPVLTLPLDQVPWDIGREQPLVAEAVEKGLFKSPVRALAVYHMYDSHLNM